MLNKIQKAFDLQNKEDIAWKNTCDSFYYEAEGYDPDAQKRYYMRPFQMNGITATMILKKMKSSDKS